MLIYLLNIQKAFSQSSESDLIQAHLIEAKKIGMSQPVGLMYAPESDLFIGIDAKAINSEKSNTQIVFFNSIEDRLGSTTLSAAIPNPLNVSYFSRTNGIYYLDQSTSQLIQIKGGAARELPASRQSVTRFDARPYGLVNPQGITFDADKGQLFILDQAGPAIVRVTADSSNSFDGAIAAQQGRIERHRLNMPGKVRLSGIAYNPSNSHLYVLSLDERRIYELTDRGEIVSTFDLTGTDLSNPQGMVFAPSADQTDDPAILHLYVADSGLTIDNYPVNRQIVELSFTQPNITSLRALTPVTLVRIIDTSKAAWSPSSPDPSGIAYRPSTGGLLISDSEVEENHPDYQGKNVFESTLDGTQTTSCVTTSFSNEPSGAAVNPANDHIFFADDDKDKVFEVDLVDGIYCNGNDIVTSLDTRAFGSTDSEGLAYGENKLFIAGGINAEVYIVDLGANGVIGGGDDLFVSQFDTQVSGISDAEGIEYYSNSGTLFISSAKQSERIILETTQTGIVVNTYDIYFLGPIRHSGLAIGPGSQNPGNMSIYMVDRGVDNNADPNENDGKVYELSFNQATATPTNTPLPTNTPAPTNTPTPVPTNPPNANSFYLSVKSNATIGGIITKDEDILFFNGSNFTMYFDGSDVGVGGVDVDAFDIVNSNTILMSFDNPITIGGMSVQDWDIVQFSATSLGDNTAGTFTMYLDGEDVDLNSSAEDIDAVHLLSDGRIIISTIGSPTLVGIKGGRDEDLLSFTPTSLGDNTSGSWTMYFDASDVGLTDDIDALDIAPDGNIYFSTNGNVTLNGIALFDEDAMYCTPISLGSNTACIFASDLFLDGSAWGMATNDVDGIGLP